ncbi:MAG: hypothetical protein ACI3YI_08555 [Bacteroidaceae bacterium]
MKLYEAIKTIVQEFGKEIVTNAKVINVFSDYNAFEESKTFKVILKNLIAEGYMDQLMYVRDWANSQDRIINNFIAATSFNEANASYVINSLAYGLGYTKVVPVYSQSAPTQQTGTLSTPNKNTRAQNTPNNAPTTVQGIKLDKTESQFDNLSETAQRKYKEAAEAYLESIVEFKSDFEKDLGIKLQTTVGYDGYNVIPRFEITGKIKVDYSYSIMFYVILYDASNRVIAKDDIYVGSKRSPFQVCDTKFDSSDFHKVCNIKRIVVYWEKN